MTCFVLKNAIDDAYSVTRCVFKMNSDNNLTEIININAKFMKNIATRSLNLA